MHTSERGIDLLPSGKYRVRVQQGGKPITVPLCASIEEAVNIRDGLYSKLAEGQLIRVDGITAEQWGPTWLRKYRAGNSSHDDDRSRYNLHIATAAFAHKPLAAVTLKDFWEWWAELGEKMTQYRYGDRNKDTLSYRTRIRCWTLASRLFSDAVTEQIRVENPIRGIRPNKTKADKTYKIPKEWPLNAEEQTHVDQILHNDPEHHIVDFAMGTGLRQGEQWNLHLEDVHLDVAKPYVWVQFGGKDCPPKNGEPRRVPLFGRALAAARAWLQILPSYAPRNPYGLMFPTPARKHVEGDRRRGARGGGRRTEGQVPDCWLKVKENLGRHVWWHQLRHTCATSLLCGLWDEKWRMEDIAILLGHGSTRTTEMYAHFLDDALDEPVARTQAAWEARGRAREVVMSSSQHAISPEKMAKSVALRNRKSQVRILPSALKFTGISKGWN